MKYPGNAYFQNAIKTYSNMLVRIAFQHTGNKAEAEDIAQDVFVEMIKHESFDNEVHMKAWLIRVAINKCKNYLKSARKRKNVVLPDDCYAFFETDNEAIYALNKLRRKDRDILHLFYFEGYSAKEIGLIHTSSCCERGVGLFNIL